MKPRLEDEPEFSELYQAVRDTLRKKPGADDRTHILLHRLLDKGYNEGEIGRAVKLEPSEFLF